MTNASPSTTVAATTAPSSESTDPSPPGPNCSASPPARLPKSFMSVSMRRHRAALAAQPQPAPAPKVVGRRKEIIARSTNAPFALGAKSAPQHGTPPPRRAGRPGSPFFRRGCPDCVVASAEPWRQINDTDIRSRASSPSHHDVYRPLSASIGLCPRVWRRRLKAGHKHAVNASLPIRKLSSAPLATIFDVRNIGETRG